MELNDRLIGFIALGCALLGLGLFWLGSQGTAYEKTRVFFLDESWMGKKVAVQARVGWAKASGNAILLGLDDGKEFAAVKFRPSDPEIALLRPGRFVKVFGRVQDYQGKPEIVIDRVEGIG